MTKRCSVCKQLKTGDDFPDRPDTPDGKMNRCFLCYMILVPKTREIMELAFDERAHTHG